jgi:hypothetical protein
MCLPMAEETSPIELYSPIDIFADRSGTLERPNIYRIMPLIPKDAAPGTLFKIINPDGRHVLFTKE